MLNSTMINDEKDKDGCNCSNFEDSLTQTENSSIGSSPSSSSDDDDHDVGIGGSSLTMSNEEETDHQLAQRETKAVFRLRFLVILVLFMAATAVSFVVYIITKNAEVDEFMTQYEGTSQKVLEAFQAIVSQKIGAISSLGVAAIAHGVDHSRTWPFVTLSSFQQRSSTARSLSNALFVSINPFITSTNRAEWEKYVLEDEAYYWIPEGFAYQDALGLSEFLQPNQNICALSRDHQCPATSAQNNSTTSSSKCSSMSDDVNKIFYIDHDDDTGSGIIADTGLGPYLAVWQTSPILQGWVNQNLFRNPMFSSGAHRCMDSESVVIGGLDLAPPGNSSHPNRMTSFYATLLSIEAHEQRKYHGDPMTTVYLPVFSSFEPSRRPVAVMVAIINWASYFRGILPPNSGSKTFRGVITVLENPCYGSYTYEISGQEVHAVGVGSLHNPKFDYLEKSASFEGLIGIADGTKYGLDLNQDMCPYRLRVYPSEKYYNGYSTDRPYRITFAVVLCFSITSFIFLCYDYLVEQRQKIVLRKAKQSDAIVSSLFPKNVRDRLMGDENGSGGMIMMTSPSTNSRLKNFLTSSDPAQALSQVGEPSRSSFGVRIPKNPKQSQDIHRKRVFQKYYQHQPPIADLFPHTTVMFADIAGFTAWSSTRDPVHVFILLQSVYQEFDALAKRHNVFKVETIGDCYLAVTGLPDPQEMHAVIMARFAGDCIVKMEEVSKDLEISLGPETGELSIRVGMHSGAVTAGVLRGERARFQLFGDTVNTASRMESTGARRKIQISQATANLLISHGKAHWVRPRKDKIQAKGKGLLSTYWLNPMSRRRSSNESSHSSNSETREGPFLENRRPHDNSTSEVKRSRNVDWICELLQEQIKKVLVLRSKTTTYVTNLSHSDTSEVGCTLIYHPNAGTTALEEIAEVICLPKFNPNTVAAEGEHHSIEIDATVCKQIREYVSTIAKWYRDNPFHNFEHACHVTMSVSKLLKRIVAPDLNALETLPMKCNGIDERQSTEATSSSEDFLASHIHDYTHGINSDPVAVLAILFSAIIHDVDHRGVSNAQLVKEDKKMAEFYRNKSVAEQNSFDMSWNLLMSDNFVELRSCIFASEADLLRFRQVMINVVMATDILDKELNDLRTARWNKAFSSSDVDQSGVVDKNDVKATIVIEHIIQASDVSHTMQHWHIYRKWNTRLYQEMYMAYRADRLPVDPSTFWYNGELAFFDNYIIPLAKKLKDCKIFGVSSDEYLNYALQNRAEWEERGMEIVEQMKVGITDALEPITPVSECTFIDVNVTKNLLVPMHDD